MKISDTFHKWVLSFFVLIPIIAMLAQILEKLFVNGLFGEPDYIYYRYLKLIHPLFYAFIGLFTIALVDGVIKWIKHKKIHNFRIILGFILVGMWNIGVVLLMGIFVKT